MKNLFFAGCIVLLALSSCRKDEIDQQIDQIAQIYIDSAGIDMLNSKLTNSYTSIQMNDVYGLTDNAPVSFNIKMDQDSLYYIEYVSGAKRKEQDSSNLNAKIYQSKIALNLRRPTGTTTSVMTHDTLVINYQFSPVIFKIQKVWYNNNLVFNKIDGQPNIIKITK